MRAFQSFVPSFESDQQRSGSTHTICHRKEPDESSQKVSSLSNRLLLCPTERITFAGFPRWKMKNSNHFPFAHINWRKFWYHFSQSLWKEILPSLVLHLLDLFPQQRGIVDKRASPVMNKWKMYSDDKGERRKMRNLFRLGGTWN